MPNRIRGLAAGRLAAEAGGAATDRVAAAMTAAERNCLRVMCMRTFEREVAADASTGCAAGRFDLAQARAPRAAARWPALLRSPVRGVVRRAGQRRARRQPTAAPFDNAPSPGMGCPEWGVSFHLAGCGIGL